LIADPLGGANDAHLFALRIAHDRVWFDVRMHYRVAILCSSAAHDMAGAGAAGSSDSGMNSALSASGSFILPAFQADLLGFDTQKIVNTLLYADMSDTIDSLRSI